MTAMRRPRLMRAAPAARIRNHQRLNSPADHIPPMLRIRAARAALRAARPAEGGEQRNDPVRACSPPSAGRGSPHRGGGMNVENPCADRREWEHAETTRGVALSRILENNRINHVAHVAAAVDGL